MQDLTVVKWCENQDALIIGSFVNVAKRIVSSVEAFGTEENVSTKDLLLSKSGWPQTQSLSAPTAKFLHRNLQDVITWNVLGAKRIGAGYAEVK